MEDNGDFCVRELRKNRENILGCGSNVDANITSHREYQEEEKIISA